MLDFSDLGCLDLDSRLLAVETIKDPDDQREQDPSDEMTGRKEKRSSKS
jgi:hypothetical protein